jgi:hypothetical protein
MQTLKSPEHLACIRHIETCAVIANEKYRFMIFMFRAKINLRMQSPGCEFPGIVQKVFQNSL